MAIQKHSIYSVGWDGYYETEGNNSIPRGGIVLHNVTHDGYNLAKEIGVVKIWVTIGTGKAIPLILGPDDFDISDYKSEVTPTPKPPQQFSKYPSTYAVSVTYTSKKSVGEINNTLEQSDNKSSKIQIIQTYIFTTYSKDPAHEPGGVLYAARIFPLIKFTFPDEIPPNKTVKEENRVKSIRVDYKLHLSLDVFLNANNVKESLKKILGRYPKDPESNEVFSRLNQVGLFKDTDEDPSMSKGIFEEIFTDKNIPAIKTGQTFAAAEKPLLYEVFAKGLDGGKSTDITWDNIHWWGGFDWRERKKVDKTILGEAHSKLPSTPGAPHAAHIHWRWSKALQKFSNRDLIPNAGDPQFIGSFRGGPLVDYSLGKQTIEFAIVQSDISSSNNSFDFRSDFKSARNSKIQPKEKKDEPASIVEGKDVVLHLYLTAERESMDSPHFHGTFFIHGLFFGHESEDSLPKGPIKGAGSTNEFYHPKEKSQIKKDWERKIK